MLGSKVVWLFRHCCPSWDNHVFDKDLLIHAFLIHTYTGFHAIDIFVCISPQASVLPLSFLSSLFLLPSLFHLFYLFCPSFLPPTSLSLSTILYSDQSSSEGYQSLETGIVKGRSKCDQNIQTTVVFTECMCCSFPNCAKLCHLTKHDVILGGEQMNIVLE